MTIIFRRLNSIIFFFTAIFAVLLFGPVNGFARQVTLQWDPNQESNLAGYRVFYRSAAGSYNYGSPTWQGTPNTCQVNDLDDYTSYYFVVRAFDSENNESGNSNEAYLPGLTAPPTPVVPDTPVATSPANNQTDVFLTPVLQAGDFSSTSQSHSSSQWRITRVSDNTVIYDIESATALTSLDVPPLLLDADTAYSWTVRYVDGSGTTSDWSLASAFTTGQSGLDQDSDGIPDNQEVDADTDLDEDGQPDLTQAGIKSVTTTGNSGQAAISSEGALNINAIVSIEATDPASLTAHGSPPDEMPLGMISFKLLTDNPGDLAEFTIYFSEAAPEDARWIKYDAENGWQDYSAHAEFSSDRKSIRIEILDGGFGDADGVANGIILDPSGFGTSNPVANTLVTSSDSVSSGGGGGGGCFISTIFK